MVDDTSLVRQYVPARNILIFDTEAERDKRNVSGPRAQKLQDTDLPALMLTPSGIMLVPESSCSYKITMSVVWSIQVMSLDWPLLADVLWALTVQNTNDWLLSKIKNHPTHPAAGFRSVKIQSANTALGALEPSIETWGQIMNIDLELPISRSALQSAISAGPTKHMFDE
jgi:hypothetical protein